MAIVEDLAAIETPEHDEACPYRRAVEWTNQLRGVVNGHGQIDGQCFSHISDNETGPTRNDLSDLHGQLDGQQRTRGAV